MDNKYSLDELLKYEHCSDEYLIMLAEDIENFTNDMDLEDMCELIKELGGRYKKSLNEQRED